MKNRTVPIILALFMLVIITPFAFAKTDVYTSTTTWTAPFGVTEVVVEVWGGGGGGGNVTAGSGGMGGGGGGGYSLKRVKVMPGAVYTVTVGSGGSPGGVGGDSWFNSTTTVLAKGGSGVTSNSFTGGSGGLASAGVGDVTYSGGNGGNGTAADAGGGGGGGAGTMGVGSPGTNGSGGTPGSGGSGGSLYGGAGGSGGNSAAGSSGNTIGGGGGGAGSTRGAATGGSGARGEVRITHNYVPFKVHRDSSLISGYDNTSATTINISDVNQAFLLFTKNGVSSEPGTIQVLGEIVNDSTLNFSRYASSGSRANMSWEIIEDTKLSVQRGKAVSTASDTVIYADFSPVDVDASFVLVSARVNSTAATENNLAFWSGKFADGFANLSAYDENNWIGTNNINGIASDPDGRIYIVGNNGILGMYRDENDTIINLSETDPSDWLGGSTVNAVATDSTGLVYIGANSGKFGVYNRTDNILYDLSATDTGDWVSTSGILSIGVDSNDLVYVGGNAGKFGVYNKSTNILTDLSAKDAGDWLGTNSVVGIAVDSTDLIYIVAVGGDFGVYNKSDDILYDLSATDTGNWVGADSILSVAVDNSNLVYIGKTGGEFGSYNKSTNVLTDLSATDTSDWIGSTAVINAIAVDADNLVYLGTTGGLFGRYNATSNTATNLTMTDAQNWIGTTDINSFAITGDDHIYTGLDSGKFGVFGYDGRTILLQRSTTGNVSEVAWQVVEWAGSQVQSGSTTLDTTGNDFIVPLTNTIDTSNAFLVLSTRTNGTTGLRMMVQGNIVNSTHVNISRQQAVEESVAEWFVVENTRFTVTQGKAAFTTIIPIGTTYTVTNTSRTFGTVSWSSTGGGVNIANYLFHMQLKNLSTTSLNVTFVKGAATQVQNASYFVIEVADMAETCTPPGDQDWYFDGRQECTFGNSTVQIDKTESGYGMICQGTGSVNFFGTRVTEVGFVEARDSCTINAYGGATIGVQ